MNSHFNPDNSTVWQELARQQQQLEQASLVELFSNDANRFEAMHTSVAGLTLDFSRNLLGTDTLDLLVRAAEGSGLSDRIRDLSGGVAVNTTENRPALHMALRDFSGKSQYHGEIETVMQQMRSLVEQVHSGTWKGCTGKTITDIVNLGIGGSHLGPMHWLVLTMAR